MPRVEVISRFFLALASSLFLFISGVSLPPLGVIILPFVAQPVLVFGLKYGVGAGLGVICLAILLLVIFAGEELALIYAVFAVLVGLLFGLLGRIRAIEQLVLGVAIVLSSLTAGLSLYFYGSWSTMFRDLHAALTQQLASAVQVQEKMGLSQESLEVIKSQTPHIVETMLQLLPALLFLSFAFIVLINILYLGRRFPERRAQWFSLRYLREWKGPEPLVWALIACGFALFHPRTRCRADDRAQSVSDHWRLLFCSGSCRDRLFFSQEQCAAIFARPNLRVNPVSTNFYPAGGRARFVRLVG